MPDVSENYSSLREAVNRILGQPAGGAGTQQSGFDLAPKPSYSSDLGNIATDATISNTPYDPYAEQNAALAATKAENDRLAAATTAAAVTTPAVTTPAVTAITTAAAAKPEMISRAALYELQKQKQMEQYEASKTAQIDRLRATGLYRPDQLDFAPTNWGNAAKPADWGRATSYMNTTMVENPYASTASGATAAAPVTKSALTKPVNPGSRAPWQASQQYWKDLEAYTRAGGK